MKHIPEIRIFRSPRADYYRDEPLAAGEVYTDDELAAIAAEGFNGIWLRTILRDVAPTDLFRKHVSRSEERLEALTDLSRRAQRHGIGVWLYSGRSTPTAAACRTTWR